MALIYEDETGFLRRGFFDVHNAVGPGRIEESYHRGFTVWLQKQHVPFLTKHPHPLMIRDKEAYRVFPDLVVWDKIVIELKAKPRHLNSADFIQLFDYLKCRGDGLGLLVNMGLDRVEVERLVYEPPGTTLHEDWKYWTDQISGSSRDIGNRIRESLRDVFRFHNTGYGEEVVRNLIGFALRDRQLTVVESPFATSWFGDVNVGESRLECLLVENEIVVVYSALMDNNGWNIHRCRSFLDAFDKQWGVAVNFGKTSLEITGVRRRI